MNIFRFYVCRKPLFVERLVDQGKISSTKFLVENFLVEGFFDCGKFSWSNILWKTVLIKFFVENLFDQIFCQKCFRFFCFQKTLVYENLVWLKENFFNQTFCEKLSYGTFPGSNILRKLCLIKLFFIKYSAENFLDQRKFLWLWNNPLSREFSLTVKKLLLRHEF